MGKLKRLIGAAAFVVALLAVPPASCRQYRGAPLPPLSRAANHQWIRDGQEFSLRFPTVETYAARTVGKRAHGDNPNEAFSSCAELGGLLDT